MLVDQYLPSGAKFEVKYSPNRHILKYKKYHKVEAMPQRKVHVQFRSRHKAIIFYEGIVTLLNTVRNLWTSLNMIGQSTKNPDSLRIEVSRL